MGGRGGFGGSGGVRVEWGAGIRSVRVGQILPKKFCLAGKVLLCYAIERKKRLVPPGAFFFLNFDLDFWISCVIIGTYADIVHW